MDSMSAIDSVGCVGRTIKLFSGKYFDLLNPNPDDLDLTSIATALSRICRYGGHSPAFYSVAEHCCWAAWLARQDGHVVEIQRAAFLHDCCEAITGDALKPIKLLLGQAYADLEGRIEKAVESRFGVDISGTYSTWKVWDLELLRAEREAMWEDDGVHWSGFEFVNQRMVPFEFWDEREARENYLDCASNLGLK